MEQYRKQLNKIDDEIRKLFEQRLDIVEKIGLYKKEHKLDIYDEVREKFIIDKGVESLENSNYETYYKRFLENLMEISKDLQAYLIKDK